MVNPVPHTPRAAPHLHAPRPTRRAPRAAPHARLPRLTIHLAPTLVIAHSGWNVLFAGLSLVLSIVFDHFKELNLTEEEAIDNDHLLSVSFTTLTVNISSGP